MAIEVLPTSYCTRIDIQIEIIFEKNCNGYHKRIIKHILKI